MPFFLDLFTGWIQYFYYCELKVRKYQSMYIFIERMFNRCFSKQIDIYFSPPKLSRLGLFNTQKFQPLREKTESKRLFNQFRTLSGVPIFLTTNIVKKESLEFFKKPNWTRNGFQSNFAFSPMSIVHNDFDLSKYFRTYRRTGH